MGIRIYIRYLKIKKESQEIEDSFFYVKYYNNIKCITLKKISKMQDS